MHVHDPAAIGAGDVRCNQLQIAGEHDEVDRMFLQRLPQRGLRGSGRNDERRDVPPNGPLQGTAAGSITRDERDVTGASLTEGDEMIVQRLQVAAAARGEHANALRHAPDSIRGARAG